MSAREAAIQAVKDHPSTTFMAPYESLADAVLAAAGPLLRAEVLREAAVEADARTESHTVRAVADVLRRMADAAEQGETDTREGASTPQPTKTCRNCRKPFDPTDTRFDGRARSGNTPYCRSCVDRCHESTDAFHVCAVCRSHAEGGDAR